MVGLAPHQGVDAVDLLEQHDEGQLVLEGEGAQREDAVRRRPDRGIVPVGAADEKGDPLRAGHLPVFHLPGEALRRPRLATLVEHDPQRPLARREQGGAVFRSAAVLALGADFEGGVAREAATVFLRPGLGVGQGWLADAENLPLHARIFPPFRQLASGAAPAHRGAAMPELSDDYLDRFSGLARLYGADALPRLHRARVAVVGTGGVGSWTAEALARSGVGGILLVDPDEICVTNTNRQLPALAGHYGRHKVAAIAERLRAIHPQIEVEERTAALSAANADELLSGGLDAVVDAIDDVRTKAHLVAFCRDRGLPLVISGGAGGKRDPASVRTADLAFATNDRLLRLVRKELRRKHGFPPEGDREPFGAHAVFSVENARYPWADGTVRETPEPGAHLRLDCATGFGTAAPVTGAFGLAAAAAAVSLVLGAAGETGAVS